MKARVLQRLICLLLIFALIGGVSAAAKEEIVTGLATDDLIGSSGPGGPRIYDGGGTYKVKGERLRLVSIAYDESGRAWVQCEVPFGQKLRRIYTELERFDTESFAVDGLPVETAITHRYTKEGDLDGSAGGQKARVAKESKNMYGPGEEYAEYDGFGVWEAAPVTVITEENGYALVEFSAEDHWFRTWVPASTLAYDSSESLNDLLLQMAAQAEKGYDALAEEEDGTRRYRAVSAFSSGLAWVRTEEGRYAAVDRTGAVRFQMDDSVTRVYAFEDGYACFKADDQYGVVDTDGNIVTEAQWQWISTSFSEGLLHVGKEGKHGYLNTQGEVALPLQWDSAASFSEGLAEVEKEGEGEADGQWGYINREGELVIPFEWDCTTPFANGIAAVRKDGLWGCVNTKGELIVDCLWDALDCFPNGWIRVKKGDQYGLARSDGTAATTLDWEWLSGFQEGLSVAERNGKYGYVDETGQVAIGLDWDYAYAFSADGLATVKKESYMAQSTAAASWRSPANGISWAALLTAFPTYARTISMDM